MHLRDAMSAAAELLLKGEDDQALAIIDSALVSARETGAQRSILHLTRLASTVHERRKDYRAAATVLEEGLPSDPLSLYSIADLWEKAGQKDKAINLYHRALDLAVTAGDQRVLSLIKEALGASRHEDE